VDGGKNIKQIYQLLTTRILTTTHYSQQLIKFLLRHFELKSEIILAWAINVIHYSRVHLFYQAVARHKQEIDHWYSFVRCAEIKAFVDQIVAPSIRVGVQNLLMVSRYLL
jgi:hypothetical protein